MYRFGFITEYDIYQFLLFLVMVLHFSQCWNGFAPVTRESGKLQNMTILSRYHGNNRDSVCELSVIYGEGTNVLLCEVWALPGLRFLNYS